jgi:predicted dehydrogenase
MFRWGLIGAGDIATRRVAPAMRDSPACQLVAIARARAELAAEFASSFGDARLHNGERATAGSAALKDCPSASSVVVRPYPRWQDLVRDPDVDGVYVATPVFLHAEQTIGAAEAGKHVLCEKPMAMSLAECDRMIAACRANGVTLGIAYYRHFYPAVARIKQVIESGEVGDPVLVQVNAFEPFNPGPDHPRFWLLKKAQSGGGPMFDFGCHRLEVLMNIFGPIRRATGMMATVRFDREVEDTAVALLQLRNGACATIAVTHAAETSRDTIDIYATLGSLHVGNLNGGDVRIIVGGNDRRESHPPAANLHRPLIDDFVSAVSSGREPGVTWEIGRAVAQLEGQIYADSVGFP